MIYHVTALEKFLVQTEYEVEAESAEQAEKLCRSGEIAYDGHSIVEGDDEWIVTLSVEEDE